MAALHGAGGSVIGPRVAERLGVPFLDRATPSPVAARAGIASETLEAVGDGPRTAVDRLVSGLARVANPGVASEQESTRIEFEERRLRVEIEEFLASAALAGGVVLGRGGAVVLADVPGAVHVYLGGPEEARIEAISEGEGLDRETARRAVRAHDRARRQYVQSAYGVDGDDPGLYHLMIDASAFDVDACVDLIVAASRHRTGAEPGFV